MRIIHGRIASFVVKKPMPLNRIGSMALLLLMLIRVEELVNEFPIVAWSVSNCAVCHLFW